MIRLVALVFLAMLVATPARAEIDRRRFRHRDCNVELSVPTDWLPTEQTSFPGLLLVAVHPEHASRLTLAAARTTLDADAGKLAEASRATLRRLGYRLTPARLNPTGAYVMSGSTASGRERVWQAYRVHAGMLYVLTLASPADRVQTSALAFGDALRTLTFPSEEVAPASCTVPLALRRP